MTYDDLAMFVAVVEHGRFGHAAREAHVSVSTLTRAVQRLERQAGARLLDREPGGVRLTGPGEAVHRHARAVLAEWRAIRQAIGADQDLVGTLRFYCTVTAAETFVPEVLERFRARHPKVRLDLVTGYAADAIRRVSSGEVDVGVAMLPNALPAGITAKAITASALRFVARSDSPGPPDWRAAEVVLPSHGVARDEALRWFRSRRIRPVIAAEADGHEAVLALVALGAGIGVVPSLVLEVSALRPRIVALEVRPALPTFHIGVCARGKALGSPVVAAFWSSLESEQSR
jgi:LysR family positive regulator for ilvC